MALAKRFHRDLPRSQLVVYDGVGHLPMEEIPARSARDAREFLLAPIASDESDPSDRSDPSEELAHAGR